MLALLLLTAVLVIACAVLGQAILTLFGWRRWRWWAPAVGYAFLLVWFGQIVHVPNHQRVLLALAIAFTVLGAVLIAVTRSYRGFSFDGALLAFLTLLLAAVPFFAAGHTGVLGTNISNDMSQHLSAAWWLNTRQGVLPVAAIGGDLITTGYPLGPHSMAAALERASGLGYEQAFSAVTLAIPILTAVIALGIVPRARRLPRAALGLIMGLGYLPAAYLAQGSFKETTEAMLVLALAVALSDLIRMDARRSWFKAAPLGLFAAAAIYTYSYGGILWIAGVVLAVFVTEMIKQNGLFKVIGQWFRPTVGALALAAIAIAPELSRITQFKKSIFGAEALHNKGNLSHSINPLETVGLWFNGDFRFNPDPWWPSLVLTVIALAALVIGLRWWWRCRRFALPAAVVVGVAVWFELTETVNIYNSAKGLVVIAPVLAATIGAPLVGAWGKHDHIGRLRLAGRIAGVLLFAGAVIASAGVLRSAPVGLGAHEQELTKVRQIVNGKSTLFLDNDHFAEWELRGAKPLYTTNTLYAPAHLGMHPSKNSGMPIDADNFGAPELDKVKYLLTAGGRYTSEIPPNFHLALRTKSYLLYRRIGHTPDRVPNDGPGIPGTILDCRSAKTRALIAANPYAGVISPTPVVRGDWQGSIAHPGQTARIRLRLPRGHWDVSLEYVSPTPVTIRAPGLERTTPANLGLITSYWPMGTLLSDGHPLTVAVTANKRSWFGQLLGKPRGTRAPLSPASRPINGIAFTRHGAGVRRVRALSACGRWVDWLAPAGSKMRGRG